MHVVLGIFATLFAFVAADFAKHNLPFAGLVNPAAMVLLLLGPLSVSMISHPFTEWGSTLRVLLRAFRHDRMGSLQHASEEMSKIARAVRETRWEEAEDAVARASSEQVRTLAAHLLLRYEQDALREAVASSSYRWMTEVRSADEFFQGLGRLSPAFGMIGTIMGLVDLFANMRDAASLGPGMAMALLATLYGLILCYCVYMPLSLRIRTYLGAGIAEQRVVERALQLILDGRPVHEVRNAFMEHARNGAMLRGGNGALSSGSEETRP
jgi:chemotaxis protein MotA